MDKQTELQNDLLYLAKRQRIIEDAVINIEDGLLAFLKETKEWQEFISMEIFRQSSIIHKNKKSFEYFRSTLRETHKQNYEKMESLHTRVNSLFDKKKKVGKYD